MRNLQPTGNRSLTSNLAFLQQLQEALSVQVKSKPYTAYITRKTPSAFVFLIDQSGSMAEEAEMPDGTVVTKATWLTKALNEILNDILDRCTKGAEIRDYFEIAVIGYGGTDSQKANFAWEGGLAQKSWVRIPELAQHYLGIREETVYEHIRGSLVPSVRKRKVWIEPRANHLTPMNDAFELAAGLLEEWIVRRQGLDIYPPTVFNITDGELTDAPFETILKSAQRIKQLHTRDGHALLFNLHISSSGEDPVLFPSSKRDLPDDKFAHLLFDLSSDLPEVYQMEIAKFLNIDRRGAFTGMAYNGSLEKIIQMMNIGTSTTFRQIQQNV